MGTWAVELGPAELQQPAHYVGILCCCPNSSGPASGVVAPSSLVAAQ